MIKNVGLRQMSVANLTVGGGSPVDLIEAAAAAGLGAVGLLFRSGTPKPLSHPVVGNPEVMRSIKAACAATGVRVFDVEAFILADGVSLATYKPILAAAAEVGATHISSIGKEWVGNTSFLSQPERVDLFGQLCDEAASFGLTVGVEFMLYRDIRTLEEAMSMIDAAGRSNAGLILDVLHFHRAGGTAAQLKAVPPERFAYVQLCDAAASSPALEDLAVEARTNRFHLGDGVVPLDTYLDVLPASVQLVIETPVKADAALSPKQKVQVAAERTRRFMDRRSA